MKRKLFTLFALFILFGLHAADEYCRMPNSRTNGKGSRVFEKIIVSKTSSSTSETILVQPIMPLTSFPVYQDRTDQEIEVEPGDEVTISYTNLATFVWVHLYAFIDYNQDNEFKESDDELVSFTYFDGTGDGVDNGLNSLGESADPKNTPDELPKFTIPADALPGKTRIRITSSWNDKNPCEFGQNADNNNQVDFTIHIKGDVPPAEKVTITHSSTSGGQLVIRDHSTSTIISSGTQVDARKSITIIAVPDAGYIVQSVTVNEEDKTLASAFPGFNYTVNEDVTVEAVFVKSGLKYPVTFEQPAEGGTLKIWNATTEIESGDILEEGTVLTIEVKLESDEYMIKSLLVNGDPVENNQFTVLEDTEVVLETMKVRRVRHSFTGEGLLLVVQLGTNFPMVNDTILPVGSKFLIKAIPSAGYTTESVTINGEDKTTEATSESLYIYTLNDHTVIQASFVEIKKYAVTFTQPTEGGIFKVKHEETEINSGDLLPAGTPLSVEVSLASNQYQLQTILVNGEALSGTVFLLNGPAIVSVEIIKLTSIAKTTENEILVYSKEGTVVIEGAPIGSNAQIYNLMGQPVRNILISSDKEIIPGNLSEKIYIVRLNDENKVLIRKIALSLE